MVGNGGALPYDAEVEYLQFDGTQYIELPIIPSEATDCIEIEFRRTNNTNQQRFFFTNSEGTAMSDIFNVYVNSSGRIGYNRNGGWAALSSNDNSAIGLVHHVLKVDYLNNKIIYDFLEFGIGNTNRVGVSNLILFGAYGTNPTFKGLVYAIRYWRSGVMIYNLQPVRKSGLGYLYDKIGGGMYGNGDIGIGYDRLTNLSDYTLLDFIQNTSTAATAPYIDTGINARTGSANSTTISMFMKVMYQDISSEKRQLMGADYNPFFGCDKGIYSNAGAMTGVVPSTTSYDSVTMDTYTWGSANSPASSPLCLFRLYSCGYRYLLSTTYINLCKLKEYKIYIDGIAVRDYVPVLHPAGVYGMFDKVENKFYASATRVGFTGGFDE